MEIWDEEVVFISQDGELLDQTCYPQFPDVPAGILSVDVPPLRPARASSLFKDHTERELIDMLHFRRDWGSRRKERFWKQLTRNHS